MTLQDAFILYVENDPLDVLALKRSFHNLGVEAKIEVTESAERALNMLGVMTDRLPDAMIVDLRMPGIGGLEFIKRTQTDNDWRAIPRVVFSTSSLEKDRSEAMAAGATDYIVKSMQDDVYVNLRNALEKALNS